MKKKQWYVFTALFFLVFLVLSWASKRPDVHAVDIDSFSDLAFWIDNRIEQGIALISIILAIGCGICAELEKN